MTPKWLFIAAILIIGLGAAVALLWPGRPLAVLVTSAPDLSFEEKVIDWLSLPPIPRTIPFTAFMGDPVPARTITADTLRDSRDISFLTIARDPEWLRPVWTEAWDPRVSNRWGNVAHLIFTAQRRIYVTSLVPSDASATSMLLGLPRQTLEGQGPGLPHPKKGIIVFGGTVLRVAESDGEILVVAKPRAAGYHTVQLGPATEPDAWRASTGVYRLITESGDELDLFRAAPWRSIGPNEVVKPPKPEPLPLVEPECPPEKGLAPAGPRAETEIYEALPRVIPEIYVSVAHRDHWFVHDVVPLTKREVFLRMASRLCGPTVAEKSWLVEISFPRHTGFVGQLFIAKTYSGWVPWYRYH